MKRPSLKLSFVVALVLLKCVASQQQASPKVEGSAVQNTVVPEALPSTQQTPTTPEQSTPVVVPPVEQTTTVAPTVDPVTTTQPKPDPTKTTDAPVVPVVPSSTTPNPVATTTKEPSNPISDTPTMPSNSRAPGGSKSQNTNIYSATMSGSVTGSVPSSTPSNGTSADEEEQPNSNKTAIIAGSVVGGIVALAFVAGLITWLNRRGGCTSRTRRRDNQDFGSHDNEYDLKMTDNHNLGAAAGGAGAGLGMAAAGGAMHSSDNLPPSPFQHARRFVPPTSNPSGYMNLTDEEYNYHQNNPNAAYQPQGYQDYNNAAVGEYNYQQGSHPDYSQDYQNDYHHQQQGYGHQEYVANEYDTGYQQQQQGGYYNQAPLPPASNVTSPTLTNVTPNDGYRQQLKPDQIEQKPNAA